MKALLAMLVLGATIAVAACGSSESSGSTESLPPIASPDSSAAPSLDVSPATSPDMSAAPSAS